METKEIEHNLQKKQVKTQPKLSDKGHKKHLKHLEHLEHLKA